MSKRDWILIAAGGSAALMLSALAFQYLGGMAPCKLCIWQRYPHVVAMVIGAIALMLPRLPVLLAGAIAAAATAGVGVYHAGVEIGIFEGPDSCTSGPISNLSAEELLNQIMAAPLVRCDDIPWELFGLSMAGWNAVISAGLCIAWLIAATKRD